MKQVTIINKVIPAESRSKYGTSGRSSVISGGASVDLSPYLLKAIWERNFEERKDEAGNEYIYIKKPIVGAAGMTLFAGDEIKVDSIFKGLPIDAETLQWVDGVLTVVGGGTGGGASNWDELKGKPSWITDTKPVYTWGEITSKPTTLSGYGIQASDVLNVLKTVDGSSSGLDADTLDSYHASGLLTSMSSSRATNLSVTVGGTTKKISSLHADYAYKLENSVTLWGQSFNGSNNVSGTLTNVSDIKFTGAAPFNIDANGNIKASTNDDSNYWHIDRYDGGNVLKILSSTGNLTINYVNRINFINTGAVYYDAYGNVHQTATSDSSYWNVISSGNVTSLCVTAKSGNVGINTSSPSQKLHVVGNILATGGVTCYSSDARAKNTIEELNLSLKQISESPTIRFKWNGWNIPDDGKTHIGGIAQYIEKILPECVIGQKDDFLSFDYATTGYVFSVLTARHLLSYETRTDRIIRKLKERIKRLERQLNIENHEEVSIVAD